MQYDIKATGKNKFNVSAMVRNFDGMTYTELNAIEKDKLLLQILEEFGYIVDGKIVDKAKRKNDSKLPGKTKGS